MKTNAQLRQYLNEFFLLHFFLDKRCREIQNTHFKFSNFSPQTVPFMSYCGKIGTARQTTNENTTLRRKDALFMLENYG